MTPEAALEAIGELHVQCVWDRGPTEATRYGCKECGSRSGWPCTTVRILRRIDRDPDQEQDRGF